MDYGKKKRKKGPKPKRTDGDKFKENESSESNETEEEITIDIDGISDPGYEYEDDEIDILPPFEAIEENEIDKNEDGRETNIYDIDNEPPPLNRIEIEVEYSSSRSYLYIFGPPATGKTVLISSILYYLQNNRSIDYGDTLKNLNNLNKKHEKEGSRLWNELNTTLFEKTWPKGTISVQNENPIPRHINAHLLTNDNKKADFEFCFIDMAGEDLSNVNHDSDKKLPDIIEAYVESLPKKNLCFTYILDPQSDILSKSEQLNVFRGFIDLLDQNDHTCTPLLLLVSKWDLVSNMYSDVEDYIKKEYPPIWGTLNQTARQISYAEFSIGEVDKDNKKLIRRYNPKYAEKVFNWFYKNQTGDSLIHEATNATRNGFKRFFKK